MYAPPSLAPACLPRRACPHSRFPTSNFRFLTSDFQFPLAPALMFTLLSTPRSLPSALSFLAVTGPRPRSNPPPFSLVLTGALKWSTALRGLWRLPALGGACPPDLWRAARGGIQDMVAAPSPVIACSPLRACPHPRLLIPLFRFLTSDFQFPLASALSTVNCLLSRLESAFTRIGPIRPRKSFGMREPVEKVASIRVFKCFRMCALKMSAFVTYLECTFTKNPGGGPLRPTVEKSGGDRNEL